MTEYKDVTQERIYQVMRQRVNAALNRTETWLDHPTFDSKSAVLEVLISTRYAAEVMYEAATDLRILHAWAFDVPWLAWSDLIVAVRSGTKAEQRTMLWRLNKAMREGISHT